MVFYAIPFGVRLRYVLKKELLFDPCLDIVGNRLPNYFVDRGGQDSERARRGVAELVRDLGPDEGALIYLFSGAIKPLAWITGTKQEASVLIHELGHTMGLATDPGHSARGHCTNAHCLMYDGVDVRTFFLYFFPTLFTGYLPLDFCSDCRSDLWEDDGGIPPGQREGEGRASRPPARPSSR